MVTMARRMGIPTITGERCLRHLTMAGDHEHAEKTDENAHIFLTWLQDMRNAAYAIAPQGSVRNQDARRDLAVQHLATTAALAKAGQPPGSPSDPWNAPIGLSAARTTPRLDDAPTTPPARPARPASPQFLQTTMWLAPPPPMLPSQAATGLLAKAGALGAVISKAPPLVGPPEPSGPRAPDTPRQSATEAKASSAWRYGGGPHRHDGYDTAAT